MAIVALVVLVALLTTAVAACTTASPRATRGTSASTSAPVATSTTVAPASGSEGVPAFAHIFVVVMENLDADGALAVPAIAQLAHRFEWTTSWYAVSHPSLPNYLAMVSGSTWGITSDCTSCFVDEPNLAAQLSGAGISWDAYFEGMPSPCFLGLQSADASYAQKHDPFAYFTGVRTTPQLCAHLQPFGGLAAVLHGPASDVPRFVWVTPDLCHDGHDCPAAEAGPWLSSFAAEITSSAAWQQGGLLVVTWDEGTGSAGIDPRTGTATGTGGGAVPAIVAAPGAPAGRAVPGPFDHYSLLRTVEDAFGLPRLGDAGASAVRPLTAFFAP